jgi:hypothetical protein
MAHFKLKQVQVKYPKSLRPEVFQILEFFIFWSICIYPMRCLGNGTQIKIQNSLVFHAHLIHIA